MDTRVRKPVSHPMLEIAAFVSDLKSAFGGQQIDDAIRRSRAGEPTFLARENGRSVGTVSPVATDVWRVDGAVRERHYGDGCDGACAEGEVSCGFRLKRIVKRIVKRITKEKRQ
ncbi:MAG TPA: hypothetical protein VF573_02065 [Paraburkholderia sp.]|uniref:hypothetical protein n=1 Tax=Paraburkholderia sp. TaxID=1926495 RepID=UPI002ED1F82F